ncbi:MFS transporter [Pseudomonas sp. RHF3.3-3]|uniref:Arabinose efflux permease family protein n=1 Tax=Pseudomonas asplenii TaxID=53407 RepID=A0A0N0VK42_9PSED|nr:MFS transporter [Pseudomonas fuscovaginae]KPA90956.1 arabinose efflux permease family protein [Pseudomonas fuscovaginae]
MSNRAEVTVSNRSGLVFLSITLLTFLAASSAPTPLYHLYQEALEFSAATLTLIFGVYALSLLAALLTVGSLSDHLGRRPVLFSALLLEIIAMGLFIAADSIPLLIAARVLQGFATGMATSALGAALLDRDNRKGPLVNSLAPLLGMACGALGASLLAEYCPRPTQLVYELLLALLVFQALYVWRLAESVSAQPGALASLRPALHVPPQARRALWLSLPVNVAVWMVGGFYSSLAPSLVRAVTGSTSNLIGGGLVAILTLSGAAAIFSLRERAAGKVLQLGAGLLAIGVALVLVAVHEASLWLFFVGTLLTGSGFGAGFLGALRSVVPLALPHERAGLMSTFYVLSYLGFCMPAFLAGSLSRSLGLIVTTQGYGGVLILLSLGALLALRLQRPARTCAA